MASLQAESIDNDVFDFDSAESMSTVTGSEESHLIHYLDQDGVQDGTEEGEEAIYDRYVPTDSNIVEEYLRMLNETDKEGTVINPKAKFIERSGNDNCKVRLDKSIVGLYEPPENFSVVCKGIYRSSFPRIENFEYLKSLNLKSILCLIPEEYPIENEKFNAINGINFFQIGMSGNKEPFVKIKPELVTKAIKILINPENQPILVHCNRGKHRTGCVIGCIRKLQKWSHSMIFDEYRRFAYPKERPLDQTFIEIYKTEEVEEFIMEKNLSIEW